jgi:xanthine/uracil/vitamin C permease (AzgA family)
MGASGTVGAALVMVATALAAQVWLRPKVRRWPVWAVWVAPLAWGVLILIVVALAPWGWFGKGLAAGFIYALMVLSFQARVRGNRWWPVRTREP